MRLVERGHTLYYIAMDVAIFKIRRIYILCIHMVPQVVIRV
jgi:hypothetical protein